MKKFLLGIALALFAGNSFAQDGFTLTPTSFTLKAGETQDIELVINAAQPLTYTSFQINIAMPEGVVPVALNQEDIDFWASMGMTIEPSIARLLSPHSLLPSPGISRQTPTSLRKAMRSTSKDLVA